MYILMKTVYMYMYIYLHVRDVITSPNRHKMTDKKMVQRNKIYYDGIKMVRLHYFVYIHGLYSWWHQYEYTQKILNMPNSFQVTYM